MGFAALPPSAVWEHRVARRGLEVAFFAESAAGVHVEGCTTGLEDGEPWWVQYVIELDTSWHTRSALVIGRSREGAHERRIASVGPGRWHVDGVAVDDIDGCLDVDLESSSLTNAFPVRRLALAVGRRVQAPAAFVRAIDLRVERLEQSYRRIADDGDQQCYDYGGPAFGYTGVIRYDVHGLALDYPGIATRIA